MTRGIFDQECTYREKVIDACKQLFTSGQEEYQKRLEEEKALRDCISGAKEDSKARALTSIRAYETKKSEVGLTTPLSKQLTSLLPSMRLECTKSWCISKIL